MRKCRQLLKGAKYHVSAKINRGEHIFEPEQIKQLFMQIVERSKKKYKYLLENFVIMNNHIHFIIKPLDNESLSSIMQWILSVFARYYNKIHKLKGHVWQGRFWSKIIDNIKQLFDTFNYISDNPVKADMVKEAQDYRYGGLYYILKGIFDIVDRPDFNSV
jgi:REP element-mobilizing transposase RayT